jgi:RHS repeat-associated protein
VKLIVAHDANGNTLSDPSGKSYSWDFENRMVSATVPGTGTVAFKYDPFGRRIYKSSPSFTGIFAYDGDDLIETANASGTEIASYTQGINIDEHLSEFRSSAASYYEQDGLGSVTSLSNSAGVLANTYTYDSLGNVTNFTGTLKNPFQYTGRDYDAETGLRYYRARYYDPQVGRFISEDPRRFDGGIDFYRYVSNNVPNKIDPFGLTPCWPKPYKLTGLSNCSVQFVSAKGFSCRLGDPQGQVQSLCAKLQQSIQNNGSASLDPIPCPSGQCCKDVKTVTNMSVVNQEFTITEKKCTVTFKLTATITGSGEVGTCSQ